MALKVELKPHERIIIGESVVTNGETRTTLLIEGSAPILREKDVLTPETATTPARRIYLTVQLMYLEKDVARFHDAYFTLTQEIIGAAPSCLPHVLAINQQILTGQLYKALKEAKALVAHEEEILSHV
jgi:flagellar protein FlbT